MRPAHKNGAASATRNGAAPPPLRRATPAADTLPAAGEAAFFTMSRAECEAMHPDLAATPFRAELARKVVRRMTEALHG